MTRQGPSSAEPCRYTSPAHVGTTTSHPASPLTSALSSAVASSPRSNRTTQTKATHHHASAAMQMARSHAGSCHPASHRNPIDPATNSARPGRAPGLGAVTRVHSRPAPTATTARTRAKPAVGRAKTETTIKEITMTAVTVRRGSESARGGPAGSACIAPPPSRQHHVAPRRRTVAWYRRPPSRERETGTPALDFDDRHRISSRERERAAPRCDRIDADELRTRPVPPQTRGDRNPASAYR